MIKVNFDAILVFFTRSLHKNKDLGLCGNALESTKAPRTQRILQRTAAVIYNISISSSK